MSNKELARRFAEGATSGKGSNMFIEGNCIYSYGRHFVIAKRFRDTFLLSTRKYSVTTCKHQSVVRGALYGKVVIECYDADRDLIYNHAKAITAISNHKEKARRARTRKQYWNSLFIKEECMLERYLSFMDGSIDSNNDKYRQPFDR